MKRVIVFSQLAHKEFHKTRDWYDAREPGLGDEFTSELDAILLRAAQQPELSHKRIVDCEER